MTYKAIFLDVDGTTVLHGIDNLPSPRVTKAVSQAMQKGVYVCLATSRPPISAVPIARHLKLNGYCVLSSGSEIYDPKKRKIILRKEFPVSAIPHVIRVAAAYSAEVSLYDGKKKFSYVGGTMPRNILGMFFPEIKSSVLQEISRELSAVEGVSLHRMEAWNTDFECLDIVRSDISKRSGVIEVMKLLGLKSEDVIGVGDGYNDFSLLEACGLKVAMGNAVPELKAVADVIVSSVEEDGVAEVIEKYILS